MKILSDEILAFRTRFVFYILYFVFYILYFYILSKGKILYLVSCIEQLKIKIKIKNLNLTANKTISTILCLHTTQYRY